MTSASHAIINAIVPPGQSFLFRQAAERMAVAIAAVGGDLRLNMEFDIDPPPGDAALSSIVILSLSVYVDEHDRSWPDVERAIRERCLRLGRQSTVFLSTVLRCVDAGSDAVAATARLRRIRRLNLLAVNLSQELKIYVIDLDRTLADIGGANLETDWQLTGPFAPAWAARTVAATILWAGLDALGDPELQDRARERILAERPPVADPTTVIYRMPIHNMIVVGSGKRRQVVNLVDEMDKDAKSGWWVKLALKGELMPREILSKFRNKLKAEGLASTFEALIRTARLTLGHWQRRDR